MANKVRCVADHEGPVSRSLLCQRCGHRLSTEQFSRFARRRLVVLELIRNSNGTPAGAQEKNK